MLCIIKIININIINKVVILGDSHIGKTSLVTRFAEGYYRENSRPATVGSAFFVTKRIQPTSNIPTKIQIWDTAGAEHFRAMAPMFYKDAAAVIVCYDVTRRESFEGMRVWLDEVRQRKKGAGNDDELVVAIAGLKTDLLQEKKNETMAVPEQEVEQLAEALGVIYLPTSAKTDRNVEALFQCVADRVLQNRQQNHNAGGMNHDATAMMNSSDGILGGSSNGMLVGNYTNNNAALSSDDRIKIISPRKRDQFDKFYDSTNKNDGNNGNSNHHDSSGVGAMDENNTSISSEKSRRGSSSSNINHGNSKNAGKNDHRSTTPSTDAGTSTATDHELLAEGNKKGTKKKKKKEQESNGLCDATCEVDEPYYACQPIACGAGSGSSGCTVQ
ncbi:hypothetical protein ACHAXR_004082 [Thalassiosira sp. AJA248-18]